ncbi:MAG: SusC/RagA family TonB-linked outer membrane protein [Chitinophagaceae bacterium]|nr:SusC/RagA family TonB-linked outer membrane protein [Chitinophagaceae bacterium]
MLFMIIAGTLSAQTRQVNGRVTDINNNGVPSATVKVKSSNTQTITDNDGNFSLSVPSGNVVLEISSVGYETTEVDVSANDNSVSVMMATKSSALEEVVVTALGIQRKAKSLTYSTQTIKGDDLTTVKDANMMNSLIGKVSGLQINRSSSGIGGSVNITLRGLKSLRNNQPLYVVDGLPIVNTGGSGPTGPFGGNTDRGDVLSMLNPDDIVSINVLKGASASALYGSEGANGAIMITTKKGTAGTTKVEVSSSAMLDQAFFLPKLQFSYAQSPSAKGDAEESWGPKGDFKNHVDGFFNTGSTLINSVSLSGGNSKSQSFFSYANTTNKGVMPTNTFNQNTVTFRNETKFFNDKLIFNGSLMYSSQKIHNRPASGLYFGVLPGLYMFPRNLDFDSYKENFEYFSTTRNLYLQNWFDINYDAGLGGTHHEQNPYWALYRDPTDQTRYDVIGAVNLKYLLNDWLTLTTRGTLNQMWNKFERKVYAGTQGVISGQSTAAGVDNGRYLREESSGLNLYGDILLIGDRDLGDNFALNFTAGASVSDFRNTGWSLDARKLKGANAFLLNAIYREEPNSIASLIESFGRLQKQAVFGSANLGFKDMIFLDLTARNDWSSSLANTPSEKSGYFYYSGGLSLVLSELMKFPDWNNLSKLRFTYAEVGNDIAQFASIIPQARFGNGSVDINNAGVFGDEPLKPELSRSYELGYEGRFFSNRLNIDVALYKTNTINQYVSFTGPRGLLNTTLYLNAGDVENKGLEIALNYDVIKGDQFIWSTGFNYTANRNKVLELHPKLGATYGIGGNFNVLRVGGSFGDFWSKPFLRNNKGKIVVSDDGTPLGDPQDGYIGTSNPKAIVGWGNTFEFGRFSASLNIDARFGGNVISTTMGYLNSWGYSQESADARDRGYVEVDAVKQDGTSVTQVPPQNWYQGVGNRDGIIEGQVYDATNIRLRDLALAYRIPLQSNVVKSATISLIGKNLFFFKNNAPYDPELNTYTGVGGQGYDIFGLPTTRSYGLNLKLTF